MNTTPALRRIYALFVARNIEFFRDRAALCWTMLLPILLIFGFTYTFSNDNPEQFKVALLGDAQNKPAAAAFLETRFVGFIPINSLEAGIEKTGRHQFDLLFDLDNNRYWMNPNAPGGYLVEKLLIAAFADSGHSLQKNTVTGEAIRYVDWVIPGILAMNIMWGTLFGVGYVIVRYRKMGVLKRLRATPVTATEFLAAQISSRLWLMLLVNAIIFVTMHYFVDFRMYGSYGALFLVFALGSICLICCGLVVAARLSSEELANGLLDMFCWPMMFLSGVWFSLEGAHPLVQKIALLLPLTHITEAAREIMIDGAGLVQIADHLLVLLISSVVLLGIGTCIFRWE